MVLGEVRIYSGREFGRPCFNLGLLVREKRL